MTVDANLLEGAKIGFAAGIVVGLAIGSFMVRFIYKEWR